MEVYLSLKIGFMLIIRTAQSQLGVWEKYRSLTINTIFQILITRFREDYLGFDDKNLVIDIYL